MKIQLKDCNCYTDNKDQDQDALIKVYFPLITLETNGSLKDCFDYVFNECTDPEFIEDYRLILHSKLEKSKNRIYFEIESASLQMMNRYDDREYQLSLDFIEYDDFIRIHIHICGRYTELFFEATGSHKEFEEYSSGVFETVNKILQFKEDELKKLKGTWEDIL